MAEPSSPEESPTDMRNAESPLPVSASVPQLPLTREPLPTPPAWVRSNQATPGRVAFNPNIPGTPPTPKTAAATAAAALASPSGRVHLPPLASTSSITSSPPGTLPNHLNSEALMRARSANAAGLSMNTRSKALPRSLGPVSAAACNRDVGAGVGTQSPTKALKGSNAGAGALATDDDDDETVVTSQYEVATSQYEGARSRIDSSPTRTAEEAADIESSFAGDAIARAIARGEADDAVAAEEASLPQRQRRRRILTMRERKRQGLGSTGTRSADFVYDSAKDRSANSCLNSCAFFFALCWLAGFATSVLVPLLYDGFLANEIDYWYPLRICPSAAEPTLAAFDFSLDYAGTACSAISPHEATTCGASRPLCQTRGCTSSARSEQACRDCCGGLLSYPYRPCIFPFRFSDSFGVLHEHRRCGAFDPQSSLAWCPTLVNADRTPLNRSAGECNSDCKQLNFVGSATPACSAQCPASGATPTAQTIVIDRSGYGGDSGFRLGAAYRLVLFSHATRLSLHSIKLKTRTSRLLHLGNFSHQACVQAIVGRRARALAVDEEPTQAVDEEPTPAESAPVPTNHRKMLLGGSVKRRTNWWDQLGSGSGLGADTLRQREGAGARWRGQSPVRVPLFDDVHCVLDGDKKGTHVYIDGGCSAMPGKLALPHDVLRAELGLSFVLEEDDFPLELTVESVEAVLRGTPARDAAAGDHGASPAVYFTFYTDDSGDQVVRYLIWVGIPVGWILLSCCCCFALCCCCQSPLPEESEADEIQERLELTELPDGAGWRRTRVRPNSAGKRSAADDSLDPAEAEDNPPDEPRTNHALEILKLGVINVLPGISSAEEGPREHA